MSTLGHDRFFKQTSTPKSFKTQNLKQMPAL